LRNWHTVLHKALKTGYYKKVKQIKPTMKKAIIAALALSTLAIPEIKAGNIRNTCDISNFNAKCAHSYEADMERTYEEAEAFLNVNVDACFGSYSHYYDKSCAKVFRGY
jgi:hypothetical protein